MPSIYLLALALGLQPAKPEVDADQFIRLLRAARSDLKDVAFIFEGEDRFVGPPGLLKSDPSRLDDAFQGTFAYRSDGRESLQSYRLPIHKEKVIQRDRKVINGKECQEVTDYPDIRKSGKVEKHPVDPWGLLEAGTPERFLFLWVFNAMEDPGDWGYEYQGWEEVDGHRCLKIQMEEIPGLRPPQKGTLPIRYWIDMDRGGWVLKCEQIRNGRVVSRFSNIKLAQVPTEDGKTLWFPVKGEIESFKWEQDVYSKPIFHESCAVVDGTLRINSGLPDSVFSLEKGSSIAENESLRAVRKQFESTPLLRSDPAGVQTRLDADLAEAEKYARQIEASSPARESWSWSGLVRTALVAAGCLLLGAGAAWRWRQR